MSSPRPFLLTFTESARTCVTYSARVFKTPAPLPILNHRIQNPASATALVVVGAYPFSCRRMRESAGQLAGSLTSRMRVVDCHIHQKVSSTRTDRKRSLLRNVRATLRQPSVSARLGCNPATGCQLIRRRNMGLGGYFSAYPLVCAGCKQEALNENVQEKPCLIYLR